MPADFPDIGWIARIQPGNTQFPTLDGQQGVDMLGEGGFAAPVFAQNNEPLSLFNMEGNPVDGAIVTPFVFV
ncbi:protein of unknown function [Brevefilum fermentans]|uniref:Uncharacterized protein n=1 Tax=Candidatus Brevifilum fermentans TaxID=1986204 RepID=A0A1Y6K697_9CHLR|nr:protein of unknown function [Brevefilum fermentans]